jgi:hypothetical protein
MSLYRKKTKWSTNYDESGVSPAWKQKIICLFSEINSAIVIIVEEEIMNTSLATTGIWIIYLALLGVGIIYAVLILIGSELHGLHIPGLHIPGFDMHLDGHDIGVGHTVDISHAGPGPSVDNPSRRSPWPVL